jgi:phasin family protein
MAENKKPSENMSAMVTQSVEEARKAMENYLNFFQKSISDLPWANTELNKKVTDYAHQNVAAAFEYSQKLTKAKDPQDLVRIQSEFSQKQLESLTEQAKDLGEVVTKTAMGTLKGPFTSFS